MRTALLPLLVLTSGSAWAVGERVVVTPAAAALRETVCVSMSCVSTGARDATVSARATKDGLELTVTSASGQVKLVHVLPRDADGGLSSIDVFRASALVLQAIEAKAPKLAKPTKKHRAHKLFARR